MRLKTLFIFILSFILSACSEFAFNMADGSRASLETYQGRWLLINYWAEWCRPCIEEIPELNKLNEEMDIQVLGYDYDKQKGQALIDKVDRLGIEFPVVMNEPSQLFSQKLPAGLPATMLVDKRGEFVTWLIGPQTVESVKKALQ